VPHIVKSGGGGNYDDENNDEDDDRGSHWETFNRKVFISKSK
jgi:hypothetical protein